MFYEKTEKCPYIQYYCQMFIKSRQFHCMDIFSPSGMILRSLINKSSKIRIPNFSISFFSKLVQWYIEHYSTEATRCLSTLIRVFNCRLSDSLSDLFYHMTSLLFSG